MPGLANLGADIQAPDADSSHAEQSGSARDFFNQKASLESEGVYTSLDSAFEAFDTHAGTARSEKSVPEGGLQPATKPKYPFRRIRFNGQSFPSVAFRPDQPVTAQIIKAVETAEKSIDIALYEFRQKEVLKALGEARRRGVKIRVIVDFKSAFPARREGQSYWPQRALELQSLIDQGFDVTILRGIQRYGIMHNKVAIFDGKLALFGSFNWSYTSERNHFENINFFNDAKRIEGLQAYWDYLRGNSVPFAQALEHAWPQEVPAPPRDEAPDVLFNRVRFPAWMFSPDRAVEDAVVQAIETADVSIDLSMFTLTSPRIVKALLEAKQEGVKVRVLVDEGQAGQQFMKPFVEWLAFHKIAVKTLAGPNPNGPPWAEKNHNKLMILDGKMVLTGSLNYTKSGMLTNFENVFFLNNKTDVRAYVQYFDDMFRMRRAARVLPPAEEPQLASDQELEEGLVGVPEPLPPAPVWADLPAARDISFRGTVFPSDAVRPQDQVQELIIRAIDAAEETIELALYEFTLPKVLEALRRAKKRKVKVRIIMDYTHVFPKGLNHEGEPRERSEEVQALMDQGFELRVLRGVRSGGIMHQKVAIFDGRMVNFGSYNWAKTAEENHFESVKFEDARERVAFYVKMWDWMWGYSVRPEDAEEHEWAKERPEHGPIDADLAVELNGEKFPRQAFSPEGLIEDAVIRAIRAAKETIDIAMFSFYSVKIAQELLAAKKRGVRVRLVLDKMQSRLMKLDDWFAYHDFDVRLLAGPNPYGDVFFEKNHNKFLIADGKFLEMGSYNYTANAEVNSYENANFYDDPVSTAFFAAYFQMLFETGWKPLKPKAPPEGMAEPEQFFSPTRFEPLGYPAD